MPRKTPASRAELSSDKAEAQLPCELVAHRHVCLAPFLGGHGQGSRKRREARNPRHGGQSRRRKCPGKQSHLPDPTRAVQLQSKESQVHGEQRNRARPPRRSVHEARSPSWPAPQQPEAHGPRDGSDRPGAGRWGAGKRPLPTESTASGVQTPRGSGERLGAGPALLCRGRGAQSGGARREPGAQSSSLTHPQRMTTWPGDVMSNGGLATSPSRAGLGTLQKSFQDQDAGLHVPT